MRNLILGAGGLIGAALTSAAVRRGLVVESTWYRRPMAHGLPLDILDDETVDNVVDEFEPDIVWLAAGMSQIDYAECHPDECMNLAIAGTANVARAAVRVGATVVLFSSDQVMGECRHPAVEDRTPAPLSVYARAQVESERIVQSQLGGQSLIIRTASVYGPHDRPWNPALHMARRMSRGKCVVAARDRMMQPTYAPDLAEAALNAMERNARGVLHIAGGERISEYAFAKQVAFLNGYDCDLVECVPAYALYEDAPRPLSPWLDRGRMRDLLGTQAIRSIGDGLRAIRDRIADVPLVRAA